MGLFLISLINLAKYSDIIPCEKNIKEDITFKVTPKGSINERQELYNDALKNFKTKYFGRMLTVEYEEVSESNVPLRAFSVGFRNMNKK